MNLMQFYQLGLKKILIDGLFIVRSKFFEMDEVVFSKAEKSLFSFSRTDICCERNKK